MDGPGNESVLPSLREPLRAIGNVVLPSPEALDEEGWREAEAIIEGALATKPASVKLQLRLFLRAVNLMPLVTTGKTLAALPIDQRARFLERIHRSPLLPLRRGLWGVRTLLFMGYYNQDRVRREIGYAAHPRGWAARFGDEPRADEADRPAPDEGGRGEGGPS